jgi:hypothetical protein
MQVSAAFAFWLGRLDSQVATGKLPPGAGTHDIRFCGVGDKVANFVGHPPDSRGRWDFDLEPYPEAGLLASRLTISKYGYRSSECALPGQAPVYRNAYPLWRQQVRLLRVNELPKDAILLLRDTSGRFHARVARFVRFCIAASYAYTSAPCSHGM